MEAYEKYLFDYSKIAEDFKLGLTTQEISDHREGTYSKQNHYWNRHTIIEKLNAQFWILKQVAACDQWFVRKWYDRKTQR